MYTYSACIGMCRSCSVSFFDRNEESFLGIPAYLWYMSRYVLAKTSRRKPLRYMKYLSEVSVLTLLHMPWQVVFCKRCCKYFGDEERNCFVLSQTGETRLYMHDIYHQHRARQPPLSQSINIPTNWIFNEGVDRDYPRLPSAENNGWLPKTTDYFTTHLFHRGFFLLHISVIVFLNVVKLRVLVSQLFFLLGWFSQFSSNSHWSSIIDIWYRCM